MSPDVPLHPQLVSLDEREREEGDGPADVTALREGYVRATFELGGAAEPVEHVEDLVVPHGEVRLPARHYRPRVPDRTAEPGLLLWLHGGGWTLGGLDSHDRLCRALCNAAGHAVLAVDYRLAPEHPWPVPAEDCAAALRWALEGQLGVAPGRVVLGGDSAGGHLAVHAALAARPLALLLVYPAADPRCDSSSYAAFAEGPLLSRDAMVAAWAELLCDADPDDASLLSRDLSGLPPAYVAVAGHDPLHDDGVRLAEALPDAELHEWPDMGHGFARMGGLVERTGELVRVLADRARAALA